jgi:hypothetical protein
MSLRSQLQGLQQSLKVSYGSSVRDETLAHQDGDDQLRAVLAAEERPVWVAVLYHLGLLGGLRQEHTRSSTGGLGTRCSSHRLDPRQPCDDAPCTVVQTTQYDVQPTPSNRSQRQAAAECVDCSPGGCPRTQSAAHQQGTHQKPGCINVRLCSKLPVSTVVDTIVQQHPIPASGGAARLPCCPAGGAHGRQRNTGVSTWMFSVPRMRCSTSRPSSRCPRSISELGVSGSVKPPAAARRTVIVEEQRVCTWKHEATLEAA